MLNSTRLSTEAAAEYLGCSASTLNKARVFGSGPSYMKLGRRVVYDTRDLDAWLTQCRRTSTSQQRAASNRLRSAVQRTAA